LYELNLILHFSCHDSFAVRNAERVIPLRERKKHGRRANLTVRMARRLHDKLLLSREIERINGEKKQHWHSDEWKWILEALARILA